jgi:Glycosyl hydrolase family 26
VAVTYPCYFGAWDPINDTFTDWSGMNKFAAAPIKSATMYIGWNAPYSYFGAFNDLCAAHGAIMYLNMEPWNAYGGGSTPSMAQIGSGAGDSYLIQLATDLKNAGHQVLITFAHEMNGTWYPWGAQAISASQWVTTWKHVYTTMKNILGSQATFVWCPNNNDVGSVSPYWPGSSFVDIAGPDLYINATGQTFASFNQSTVNEIGTLTSGPVWNAETGITLGTYTVSSWVNDMANAGLYGFTQWNESIFALSAGNISSMCTAVNAWNNAASSGSVVTSTGGLSLQRRTFVPGSTGNNNPGGSQTLTVTPQTATQAAATAGISRTTATVSPSAGSMVRVCVAWFMFTNETGLTFTCQDNLGNVYNNVVAEGNAYGATYSLIFDFQYASAPGPVSFIVASSSSKLADCLIQPYLITGQAYDQSAAATSRSNSAGSSTTSEITIQNNISGSYLFVVAGLDPESTPTAISGTTQDSIWNDGNSGVQGIIGHSTSATGTPGANTLGWTLSPASIFGYGIAAAEVVPAPNTSGGSNSGSIAAKRPSISATGSVAAGPGTSTLFAQATPGGTINSGAGNAGTNGIHFTVSSACNLSGVWHYSPSSSTQLPTSIGLYTTQASPATGTLVTSNTATWSGAVGSGWVFAPFTSPPALVSGTNYMATQYRNDAVNEWFVYYTVTWPVTSGVLTAPQDVGAGQGWFDTGTPGSMTFPASQLAGDNFGMDVQVSSPAAFGGPNTPKRLISGTGTVGIVNVSCTGSMQFGGRIVSIPGASNVSLTFPANPLGVLVEMLVNGTWIDISKYVYRRDDIVIDRGSPNETTDATPGSMTFTLNNRDGRFSTGNPNSPYAPYLTRNTQVRLSVVNQASSTGQVYSGYRYWGELGSIPPSWDNTGRDVFVQGVVNGPLRRYIQGAKMGSPLYRYYSSLAGTNFAPYAVWPAEDGGQATEIASILPSVSPMAFTGKPSFAQNSLFGGSDPLPAISGSVWHGQTGAVADPPGTGSILNNVPGTYTWIAPPGVTAVTSVICTGSGGGGGDTDGTTGGSGGGAGGSGFSSSVGVTPGKSYTYIVPSGGAAGSGGPGSSGSGAAFTGDNAVVSGAGGNGGAYAGGPGGSGGIGDTHNGGSGAVGQSSSTANFENTIYGNSGANGGGTDANAGSNQTNWIAPPTVTTVTVNSLAGGGGASAGRGNSGSVGGGGGGGGGSFATGTISVTPGHAYAPYAGNGGNGGSGSPGGGFPGPSNSHGDVGGNSGMAGDSGSSVVAGGGGGGASTTAGAAGNVVSGGGNSGGVGGTGTAQVHGGGASGGGPGSNGSAGTAGSNGNGDSGGANRIAGDGGSVGSPGKNGSEYGNAGSGGGGGGCNATLAQNGFYGPSGGGGSGGYTNWQWTVTGAPIGGGGGGAAGSSSNGSNGSTNGTGGSSPGGGTGGSAGSNPGGIGPGGGGAGATPSNSTVGNPVTNPGPGANGAVGFSWSGGITSPVASDFVRFLLAVNSAGAADGAVLARVLTYGTIARADLIYHTGGKLQIIGYNSSSVQLFDSGSVLFGADGTPLYMSIELVANGANVDWALKAMVPGVAQLASAASGSVTGSVGNVSDIYADPNGTIVDTGTSIGWFTVQTYADNLLNLSDVSNGHSGELASVRMSRLCADQGLGFSLVGNDADTPQMGPQQNDTFINVIQSCGDIDRGQIYETRSTFGIGYRTRKSMQLQDPKLIASYKSKTLATPPLPVADDQFTRNDITITRNNGASARASLASGVMSTLPPPDGVGDYTYQKTVHAFSDSQLQNRAQHELNLGTVAEYRFPQISFELSRPAVADLMPTIASLDIGDYVQVPDPPTFLQTSPISQLCWGFTETISNYRWAIRINAVPESPYGISSPPNW